MEGVGSTRQQLLWQTLLCFRTLESVEGLQLPGEDLGSKLWLILVSYQHRTSYSSSAPSPWQIIVCCFWSSLHKACVSQGGPEGPCHQMLCPGCCLWLQRWAAIVAFLLATLCSSSRDSQSFQRPAPHFFHFFVFFPLWEPDIIH